MSAANRELSKTIRIDVLPKLGDDGRPLPGGSGADPSAVATVSPLHVEDFRRFFEHAYDATLITDDDGFFVLANRRVKEQLGYDPHDLHGVSFHQLVSGAGPDLIQTVRDSIASARFLRISAWCVRKDGVAFPAVIAVNPLVSDGRVFYCFFIRDETLRNQAETELRTVQNAVRNAGTGIAVASLEGAILYANPAMATVCGCSAAEDLTNRPLADILGDADLVNAMLGAVRTGQGALVETEIRQPDGTARWVQASAAPNLDGENNLIGMVLSFVDIGDRRRAELAERALERDRVMMESLGAVCHHLGQPATVLLSSIEMLNRLPDSDRQMTKDLLEMSLEAAESLRKTLQELNDLRHYHSEPYPGPSEKSASAIVKVGSPAPESAEATLR